MLLCLYMKEYKSKYINTLLYAYLLVSVFILIVIYMIV